MIPRAGRSGLAGTRGGALLVRLAAAPVGGRANEELLDVLAKALSVPPSALRIERGERARRKLVSAPASAAPRLGPLLK